MKKFLALFAFVACFSFAAQSQTVLANLFQYQGKFYYLDSLGFGSTYQLNQQLNLQIYIYLLNDGDKTITTSDSVKIHILLNNQSYGNLTINPQNDWMVDSMWLVSATIPLYVNPDYLNLSEGYDNTLCSHVSGVVFAEGGLTTIDDEGFCGVFQINGVGINEKSIENIAIYPNPVRDMLNIENANNVNVSIYSANGQLVKTINNVNGDASINMSEMSNGLYFVKLQDENASRIEKIQVIR